MKIRQIVTKLKQNKQNKPRASKRKHDRQNNQDYSEAARLFNDIVSDRPVSLSYVRSIVQKFTTLLHKLKFFNPIAMAVGTCKSAVHGISKELHFLPFKSILYKN